MDYQNILVEREDGTVILTINRPEARNALSPQTWLELKSIVADLKHDSTAQVVIITGAGGKAFASGADIKSLQKRTMMDMIDSEVNDTLFELTNLRIPVIAAVDGYALGGGCELAMSCDIRIATKQSKFGQPEVKLGIIASGGGTSRLCRLVGVGKAKELLFTGDIISAEEACRIGLVQKVIEDGQIMQAAREMADKIKINGPVAVSLSKMAVNISCNVDLKSALLVEKYFQAVAFATEDRLEGTTSFVEKRQATFKGC